MASIRCFIAVEIDDSARGALSEISEALSKRVDPRAVRWVQPKGIHLTLKFLGDTDPAAVPRIGARLDQIAAQHRSFQLQLGKLGCFPNPRRPRVIWLGVEGQIEPLAVIQQTVEAAMEQLGWQNEGRDYTPHLTLGRVKESQQVVDARFPWGQRLVSAPFMASKMCLYESELRPSGALYSVRYTSNFEPNFD